MRKGIVLTSAAALVLALSVPAGSAVADAPPRPDAGGGGGGGVKSIPESPTGSYIVVMKQDPLVATVPSAELTTPEAKAAGDVLESSHDAVLTTAGAPAEAKLHDYTNALNGFSAVVSHDQAVAMAANPKVASVLPDELRQATSVGTAAAPGDSSSGSAPDDLGRFLGLTSREGAWRNGITGEGVVVGVIDTGIWPEHPSFADDGTLPEPTMSLDTSERSACDFGNTAHNAADARFTCNHKLIGARMMLDTYRAVQGLGPNEFESARDNDGHGTHTASTAAGDADVQASIFGRNLATISGIAPRAQIIAYKALGDLGGFTSDLAAAIDQAVADGVDVINYSVGGGAQTVSGDTIAFLFAADAGVFTAVSAGNAGPGAATIGGPADVPWVTAVGANTMPRSFQGSIRLDHGPTITGASVTGGTANLPLVDAATAGGELCRAGTLDPAKVTGKIVLCKRGGNGRVAKSFEVSNAGGAGMIMYNATDTDNLFTDNFYVPSVMVDYTPGLKVKTYIATRSSPKATLQVGGLATLQYAPSMTLFSSRGPNPTAADIIKPDVTAPGIQVLAGDTPSPMPGSQPAGELFQAIAGTSMSSPVVAGVYALLKQAHPDWSAAAAKSAIMTTANVRIRDNDRTSPAGPFAMGSGMVNPGGVSRSGSAFNPGLVYDAGFTDYLGFLCDAGRGIFPDPDATCAGLANNGIPTVATDLNLSSVGVSSLAGSQTVRRTVTSVADRRVTWRPSVQAPSGYRVTVSPDQFTLAPGDSATFTVTITNRDATVGEWRTGSLSWNGTPTRRDRSSADPAATADSAGYGGGSAGDRYQVRSPIAVRGVALQAPATLSGTGTSGSAGIDVKFGYTGAYTATAHGLVAPIDTTRTISQDPDQTYPSADDGAGVVAVPVTISGAAFARWSLVIPGNDDLDLYLLDSRGNIIDRSTNGGTNERIDLAAPPDGTYTLIVHGWAVASPRPFTLQNWVVPSTSGGSLAVTSAPTAATAGATGTVQVSWTGAAAGVTSLGAVSHSDADGILALTIVDVTG